MNAIEFYEKIVRGKAWAKNGKLRIYAANTNKVQDVYLDFPDGTLLGGAAAKCFIKECGQSPAWYKSQRELADEGIARPMFVRYLAASAFAGARPYDQNEYTDAEVDAVCALFEDLDLPEISHDDVAMHNLETAAAALAPKL